MIATLASTMPSRLALGEPKENMICASAVAAGKVDQFALQIEQTVIAFASAIFLLWLQFDYLVSLFFIVFDFAPKHPRQCEHRIEQHGDDTIEQECSRAHVNVPSLPRVVALDTKRGFLTVIPIHKRVSFWLACRSGDLWNNVTVSGPWREGDGAGRMYAASSHQI